MISTDHVETQQRCSRLSFLTGLKLSAVFYRRWFHQPHQNIRPSSVSLKSPANNYKGTTVLWWNERPEELSTSNFCSCVRRNNAVHNQSIDNKHSVPCDELVEGPQTTEEKEPILVWGLGPRQNVRSAFLWAAVILTCSQEKSQYCLQEERKKRRLKCENRVSDFGVVFVMIGGVGVCGKEMQIVGFTRGCRWALRIMCGWVKNKLQWSPCQSAVVCCNNAPFTVNTLCCCRTFFL